MKRLKRAVLIRIYKKVKKQNQKKAFTLAETVISLAILGMIAALTIPVFFTNTASYNNQYVVGLKKVYSELNYATQQVMANNSGTLAGAYNASAWQTVNLTLTGKLCQYLKCSKICDYVSADTQGCFNYRANIKFLDNQAYSQEPDYSQYRGAILADGALINVATGSPGFYGGSLGYIWVDVNGLKGPNIVGRDIFIFNLESWGLSLPTGTSDTGYCNPNVIHSSNGDSCSAKVLQDGKMMY